VSLPVAIVDALNASDVEYGEVLVYEVDTQGLRFSFIDCHIVTLRFTDFKGMTMIHVLYCSTIIVMSVVYCMGSLCRRRS